jgi:ribosomal protein L35
MKQKTKKAAKKRFFFSSTGKAQRRHTKQSHFNARATGNETRKKHPDKLVAASDLKNLKSLLPYK